MEQEYSTGRPRRRIQVYDWSVSVVYHMVSLKTTISSNSALSRRLPRFHVVYAQTMETFFFYQGS